MLNSCSSSADSTKLGTDTTIPQYKTYSISLKPDQTDELKHDYDVRERIFFLIDTVLQSKGYEKLDSNADLTVFPYIIENYDPFDISGQVLPDTINIYDIAVESLIIDIIDSKTQNIIFRGVSSFRSANGLINWSKISNDIYVSLASIVKTSLVEQLPNFPWPPPHPSTFYSVATKYLISEKGVKSYGDVQKILRAALDKNGYSEISYFRIPGGFVVVTRVEQIDENGYSKPLEERWVEGVRVNFPENILEVIFGQKRGYYRLFVLAISEIPFSTDGKIIYYNDIKKLPSKGWNYLPSDVLNMPFTTESKLSVLVYEYMRKGKGTTPGFISDGKLTAKQHLEKAGLLRELTN
jgi:hypothetical protein